MKQGEIYIRKETDTHFPIIFVITGYKGGVQMSNAYTLYDYEDLMYKRSDIPTSVFDKFVLKATPSQMMGIKAGSFDGQDITDFEGYDSMMEDIEFILVENDDEGPTFVAEKSIKEEWIKIEDDIEAIDGNEAFDILKSMVRK